MVLHVCEWAEWVTLLEDARKGGRFGMFDDDAHPHAGM
jgi:hypothetical protein